MEGNHGITVRMAYQGLGGCPRRTVEWWNRNLCSADFDSSAAGVEWFVSVWRGCSLSSLRVRVFGTVIGVVGQSRRRVKKVGGRCWRCGSTEWRWRMCCVKR